MNCLEKEPRNGLVVAAALAAAAAILTFELLVPPILGLANNGDFDRVTGWAGLRSLGEKTGDGFANWVPMKFGITRFAWRPTNYLSSETPLAALAVLAARVFTNGVVFDIRFVAGLHMLLLLSAIGLIVTSCRNLAPVTQWLVAALLVFVFTDVGYAAQLNSLYSQTAAFLFLMLTVAAAAAAIHRGGAGNRRLLLGYFACAALFVGSRPQESLQGPLLALFGLALAGNLPRPWRKQPAIWLAIGLIAFSLAYLRLTPSWYRHLALYDALFLELLPGSRDAARDLKELDLDPGLIRYRDLSPYSAQSPLSDPAFQAEVYDKFGHGRLLHFLLRHPERLISRIRQGADSAFDLRPLVLANYARESGLPPGTMTRHFAWWSDRRAKLGPRALAWLALLFGCNLVASRLGYRLASRRGRLIRQGVALLVLMSGVEFLVAILGDTLGDLARHLSVFHAICDLLLIADAAWLIQALAVRMASPAPAATPA